MNAYSIALLCFAFGVLLIAILSIAKRKDNIGYRFFNFSIAVGGWGILAALWISQNYSKDQTLFLVRLSHVFAVFVPITWVHFVFELIRKKEPVRFFYGAFYAISAVLSAMALTPFFIDHLHSILGFKYYTGAGPLYFLLVGLFYFLVPFGAYYLYKAYAISVADKREQLRFLIIGTIVGFSGAGSSMLAIYNIPFPVFLFYLMPVYPILTGIALIKYGLFDVQEIADAFQREKMTALGIMAASLNHEIRNPLYIAKGRIETYLDGVERGVYETQEIRQTNADTVLNSASNQLQRAMDIMQRFSDFAKPFNAQKDKQIVELESLLKEVRELVSHALETRHIILKENLQRGLQIQGHRRQIEEVFVNLLMNAIQAVRQQDTRFRMQDASDKPAGTIEISAERANGNVRIQIKDNGSGMDSEQLKRIFEPFYTTKDKGTGLGLYITRQLVERNGGKIEVRSKQGEGTVFTLIFKAPKAAEENLAK